MKSETKQKVIQGGGLTVLAALFVIWCGREQPSTAGFVAALTLTCLFAAVCLRFVPLWIEAWSRNEQVSLREEHIPAGTLAKIFFSVLLWDVFLVFLVTAVRFLAGEGVSPEFWRCTDSRHYLDIAEEWYLSEGSIDRLVQLVFLPGYPIAVRLVRFVTGDYLAAGMAVSALCFAASACVFYKLLCLDTDGEKALRALIFLCLFPGAFFFAAPMSESLFLLLSLSCVYMARKEKFLLSCLFGGLAAFTRSVGLALIVPVLFELITQKKKLRSYLPLLLIPAGFGVYCLINYFVAGDAFKFMEYQREHWHQSFGLFFGTAAYQTDYAMRADIRTLCGLWLPNLIALFGAPAIILAGEREMRPSYTAYFIAYYFVAMGATWLLSAPRYMLVMFPLCIAMGEIADDGRKKWLYCGIFVVLGLLYLIAFAMRWQVW